MDELKNQNREFKLGDYIVYELKNSNSGRKYICLVAGEKNGWILDHKHGIFESSSFHPDDVIIWEHVPYKQKDRKKG